MRIVSALCFFFIVLVFVKVPENSAQPGKYKTLGFRTCGTGKGTCHESDGNWWKADAHFESIKKFKAGGGARAKQIAQLYGMRPGDYLKGNLKCGECHGEVVSKRQKKNMNTGVSCESCHGPSGPQNVGYFEVHQIGDPKKESGRQGYVKGLRVGLQKLSDVNVRAKACVRCHYINEKKLLEAGHPTGETFNYVRGITNSISNHWDYEVRPADKDKKPYEKFISKRGPIPTFKVKALAQGNTGGGGKTKIIYIRKDPLLPSWLNPNKDVTLPPFNPQVSDSSSIEEILTEIKNRIETIHKAINKK